MRYEYVAVREKPSGKNQSWGAYHVALWSKWGEKGMDGDGVEYIYKHFGSEQTWGTNDDNPANWAASTSSEYYGPSGHEWSDDPTGVDSTNKFEYVSVRRYKLWPNETSKRWGTYETPKLWSNYAEAQAAVPGPKGDIGPMSYLAGVWNATTTYTKTTTRNPIVYRDTRDEYYYLVGTPTENTSVTSTNEAPESHSSVWAQAENYNTVFTDVIFAKNFAKLGQFIINKDWMLCQYGTIYDYGSGTHPIQSESDSISTDATHTYTFNNAYILFDPAYPNRNKPNNWNFVPNYAVNAVTGELYCNDAHITGTVNADSGTFNGTVNATSGVFNGIVNATSLVAGDTSAMNIKTSSNKIEFCQGTNTIAYFEADGSGIQLHIWDSNGEEYTIDFTKWNAVNQGTFNNETWYQLGGSSTGPTSITLSLNSSDNKYYYNANTSSGLVNGTYYIKSDAKVFDLQPLDAAARPEIFAPYLKPASGTNYALALNNVSKYTKYTFTNGVKTATTDYLYHTTAYPNTVTFNGDNVKSISQYKSTYLNPRTTESVSYRWTPQQGTEAYSQTVICAEAITGATHYSTSPVVYAVALPTPTPTQI